MKLAVIADVHANLVALEAVIDRLEKEAPERVICLGDLVGYGAHPPECIARVQELADVVVLGNHDRDVARGDEAPGTSRAARSTQLWTRECLNAGELAYLGRLSARHVDARGFQAVHGSFLNDEGVSGYVTSSMLEANLRRIAARSEWPKIAFCGHTHVPLAGWLANERVEETDLSVPIRWPRGASAVLVNPGSVGQPRDGDPRAAYAMVDLEEREVRLVRVPYDTRRAAESIYAAGLPSELGERLHAGR